MSAVAGQGPPPYRANPSALRFHAFRHYRRRCIEALKGSWEEERKFADEATIDNQKNYQVW